MFIEILKSGIRSIFQCGVRVGCDQARGKDHDIMAVA